MKHFFYKGDKNCLDELHEINKESILGQVKKDLSKILETRNLSFLIGSGCSLHEFGIPTMKQLADNLFEPTAALHSDLKNKVFQASHIQILNDLKIKYKNEPFRNNLEAFLGTLFSYKYYLEQLKIAVNNTVTAGLSEENIKLLDEDKKEHNDEISKLDKIIKTTKEYILFECLNEKNKGKDEPLVEIYKQFYRKLSLRDSNLSKPNVFTTNYDLYSERALDSLGISYTNGFSGFVERFFNPSIFNYALAEQMEISSHKWSVIDSFIYLFKIHGSVNWIERNEENQLFSIQEIQDVSFSTLKDKSNYMIYPSPLKQNASLGSPYSDLFREFQKRVTQKQSTLVTMGFSFGDEHINNIIFQALTVPSFRLVIFSDLGFYKNGIHESTRKNIEKLRKLNDPRIWIIGSDNDDSSIDDELGLHFFATIARDLFPDYAQDKIEQAINNVISLKQDTPPTA